jgi:hypothetical protein
LAETNCSDGRFVRHCGLVAVASAIASPASNKDKPVTNERNIEHET